MALVPACIVGFKFICNSSHDINASLLTHVKLCDPNSEL